MAYLTYNMLLKYLNEQMDISQKELGEYLGYTDASTINRLIKKPTKKMAPDIPKKLFYEKMMEPYFAELSEVKKLYKYIERHVVITDEMSELYDTLLCNSREGKTKNEKETIKKFLSLISDIAENNRNRTIQSSDEDPEVITFAPANYHPVEKFIGRDQLMVNVSHILDKYGLVVICGMGGLGKTQSARYYAVQSKQKGIYKQVQRVDYNKNLKSTLLDIDFNGLKEYQKSKQDDEEKRIEIRLEILSKFGKEALLIIDNMDVETLTEDDSSIMNKLVDMDLRVIITSRNTHLYANHCLIKIDSLLEDEQLKLFILHYSNDKNNPIEIPEDKLGQYKKILHMVSGHTMLIELIAKTMKEYSISPKKMIKILSEGRGAEDFDIEVEKDNNYKQEDIYDTISTLFNISKMELNEKKILMKLAFSSISGVRLVFFDDYLLDGASIKLITSLIHRSWILREEEQFSYNDRISLHPLITSTIIRNIKPSLEEYRDFIEFAIKAYNADDDEITHSDRSDICNIIIKAGEMFKNDYGGESIDLLLDQIHIIYKGSHFTEAYQQCNLALQICMADENNFLKQLPYAYSLQADVAVKIAKYSEAIDYYIKAIKLWEKEPTPPYENIAETFIKLGNVHRKNSDYTKALDNFRKAETRIDVSGIDKPFLKADIFNNIGIVYINLDNLDKAMENYEKGRVIREELVRVDPQPEYKEALAYSYHNIGTVYQRKHEMDKAFEWHKKALPYREEVYHPLNEVMADSYTMIGNDYAELSYSKGENHYEEAYDFIIKGLNIRMNTHGPDHPATAWSYESLGKIYYYQKKYREAQDSFRKCLMIREKSLTSNHAYIGEALVWLGKASIECGELELASEYLQKAYDIQGGAKKWSAQKETAKIMKNLKKKKITNKK